MPKDLESIQKAFEQQDLKSWELEGVIFKDVYGGKEQHLSQAALDAESIRARGLEREKDCSLEHTQRGKLSTARLQHGVVTTGIELKIGAALLPLGVAGPVTLKGQQAVGAHHVPLATNEAALVAGMQRGFKAINAAGGLHTLVNRDGMSRAPVLEAPSITAAQELVRAFEERENAPLFRKLAGMVEEKDAFCRLADITAYPQSNKVWLRCTFKTGDAMGMNSVTQHTASLMQAILKEPKFAAFRLVALSGNLCTDKKSSHNNIWQGRGKRVETEVIIPEKVLKETFKKGVSSSSIEKINFIKNYQGSALSGTLGGYNANAANAVAAVFAATGQDLAQVVESSSCFTHAEVVTGGLRFGVTLPNMEVATVGGGTGFGTAKECLALMGCTPPGSDAEDNASSVRLAEIIGAAVTAQELNLLAAFAAGYELAESHVKLARGEQ